jgi:hypothetical protein
LLQTSTPDNLIYLFCSIVTSSRIDIRVKYAVKKYRWIMQTSLLFYLYSNVEEYATLGKKRFARSGVSEYFTRVTSFGTFCEPRPNRRTVEPAGLRIE